MQVVSVAIAFNEPSVCVVAKKKIIEPIKINIMKIKVISFSRNKQRCEVVAIFRGQSQTRHLMKDIFGIWRDRYGNKWSIDEA